RGEMLHDEVRMIVRRAEIEDPNDMRMPHRGDRLILEQKALEYPPAGRTGRMLHDLADDPRAARGLGEIDRREIRRVQALDETVAPRSGPRPAGRDFARANRRGGPEGGIVGGRPLGPARAARLERVAKHLDQPAMAQIALR